MINWTRVEGLKQGFCDKGFDDVVEVSLEEVEAVIDRLKANPCVEDLEADMHFLKGCALNLGFEQLEKVCVDGKKRAATGNLEVSVIHPILMTYDQFKSEFSSQLGLT